jgi:hypothetical protein
MHQVGECMLQAETMEFDARQNHRARCRTYPFHRLRHRSSQDIGIAVLRRHGIFPRWREFGSDHIARDFDIDWAAVPAGERQHSVDLGRGGFGIVKHGDPDRQLGEDVLLSFEIPHFVVDQGAM